MTSRAFGAIAAFLPEALSAKVVPTFAVRKRDNSSSTGQPTAAVVSLAPMKRQF
jgi:hypothetical protein